MSLAEVVPVLDLSCSTCGADGIVMDITPGLLRPYEIGLMCKRDHNHSWRMEWEGTQDQLEKFFITFVEPTL